MNEINWAIIGAGNIAKQFTTELQKQRHTNVIAVTARSEQSTKAFAAEFNVENSYDSIDNLLKNDQVDIVYIATPHQLHFEQAKQCLEAGKAVLCEKPMTLNAKQSAILVELATSNKLFLMEAMITSLLPSVQALQTLINDGELGEVQGIQSSMGFNAPKDNSSRIFNPELAGGALLDIGIYPLTFTQIIAQKSPISITSQVVKAQTGVDQQSLVSLQYADNLLANCACSVVNYMPCFAAVYGSKLTAELPNFLWGGNKIILSNQSGEIVKTINIKDNNSPYFFEASHVNQCLRDGLIESPLVPHERTLQVLQIMDTLRDQWALTYPGE